MKKLRLLLWENCNRNCEGCCNKQFDLKSLPIETDFSEYDKIMLTGGEPMIDHFKVMAYIDMIREQNRDCKIIVYTAKTDYAGGLYYIFLKADGLTVTLHDQSDLKPFMYFDKVITTHTWTSPLLGSKSLRLNVFHNVDLGNVNFPHWNIKDNIRWIENCPLPTDEVLMRAPEL